MRIAGIALFLAWLFAWSVAPHGEPNRQTSIVGGVAAAGGDRAAVAWLELKRGSLGAGTLHVTFVEESHVMWRHELPVADDTAAFRLAQPVADSPDSVVLIVEHRSTCATPAPTGCAARRSFEAFRLGPPGPGRFQALGEIEGSVDGGEWQLAAAGSEIAIAERIADTTRVTVLSRMAAHAARTNGPDSRPDSNETASRSSDGAFLIGSGRDTLIRYERGRHGDRVTIAPGSENEWSLAVASPVHCADGDDQPSAATARTLNDNGRRGEVIAVASLRGGFARLSRLTSAYWCIDGQRDGRPFLYRGLALGALRNPGLAVDNHDQLSLTDSEDGLGANTSLALDASSNDRIASTSDLAGWRERVEQWVASQQARRRALDNARLDRERALALQRRAITAISALSSDEGVRYRLWAGVGQRGATALITRIHHDDTEVVVERWRAGDAAPYAQLVLGPDRSFRADHRPALRRLALLPLLAFALSVILPLRRLARLRRLRPLTQGAPLSEGETVVIDGRLADGADAPAGALRIRRASQVVTVHIEGADVLRASDLRGRTQPRGDAIDVAPGSPIVVSGRVSVRPGSGGFRAEPELRAGKRDLVLVGYSLSDAIDRLRWIVLVQGTALASVAFLLARVTGLISGCCGR